MFLRQDLGQNFFGIDFSHAGGHEVRVVDWPAELDGRLAEIALRRQENAEEDERVHRRDVEYLEDLRAETEKYKAQTAEIVKCTKFYRVANIVMGLLLGTIIMLSALNLLAPWFGYWSPLCKKVLKTDEQLLWEGDSETSRLGKLSWLFVWLWAKVRNAAASFFSSGLVRKMGI